MRGPFIGIRIGSSGGGAAAKPVLVSAVIENAAPTVVVLTYDMALDDTLPDKSAFKVTDNTVSSIALDGTKKILSITLSADCYYFDVMSVQYLKPVSNPLKSGTYEFSSFENAITNNITSAGVIGKWDLDGNVLDSSGNGYDLTNANAVPAIDRDGIADKAMGLATNAWLTRENFTQAKVEEFTAAIWVKVRSFPSNYNILMSMTDWQSMTKGWGLYTTTGGDFRMYLNAWSDASAFTVVFGSEKDRWHCFIVSYNKALASDNIKVLMDSVLTTKSETDAIDFNGAIFDIGKGYNPTFVDMIISDHVLFPKELTSLQKSNLRKYQMTYWPKWYDTFQRVVLNTAYVSAYYVYKSTAGYSATVNNKLIVKNGAADIAGRTIIGIRPVSEGYSRTNTDAFYMSAEIDFDSIEVEDLGFGLGLSQQSAADYGLVCVWNANDGKISLFSNDAIIQSSASGLVGTAGTNYKLEVTNNRWSVTAIITDVVTPANTYTYTFAILPNSANGWYNQAYFGMYFFNSVSNCNVYNITVQNRINIRTRVLYIGDSNAWGYTLDSFSKRFSNIIHGNDNSKFANLSGIGDTSEGLNIATTEIANYKSKYAVIQMGANDNDATGNYTMARIPTMIARCNTAGIIPIMLSLVPRPDWNVTVTNGRIEDYCTTNSIKYIDLTALLDDGTGDLKPIYDNGDGYHLNAAGHTAIAAQIISEAPELILA